MLFQAQKRKLGLLDDEDMSNLEDTVSNKKQNSGENLSNKRGVFDHCYIRFSVTNTNVSLRLSQPLSHFLPFVDNSDRAFYKELVKVIEASDVILEVLDARDPLGTRCVDMEKMVMRSGPEKHIVLLLNKIGLLL